MRLLYGTGNEAKLAAMKRRLCDLDAEIIGIKDLGRDLVQAEENYPTPLENAVSKAKAYYEAFGMPVFSCDSGLYFDDMPEALQPGVHVRRVGGKHLTDEEMLAYYSGLARKYGNLRARYRNAICLILDEGNQYQAMEDGFLYFFQKCLDQKV